MGKTSIRKNDMVIVTAGKEKGKKGKVLRVVPEKKRVIVEKINFIKKHQRPTSAQKQGGIIEKEGLIHISNVMIFCEKCGKGVRVRHQRLADGSTERMCAGCGESFD
ncbi:MAG: 50S ribosomal protein L24 [bacterium]|nr:MAG: 50S ribosomal protein L24 [bacterium]